MIKKILFAILFLLPIQLNAETLAEGNTTLPEIIIPDEVKQYRALYEKISQSTERQSLSKLFELGEKASQVFQEINSEKVLVKINLAIDAKTDLAKEIAKEIPGYLVGQGAGQFYYYLKSDVYLDLAKKQGLPEDIVFFEAYNKILPRGDYWPIYYEQRTDVLGCNNYNALFTAYELWRKLALKTKNPIYRRFATNEIYNLRVIYDGIKEDELTPIDCSCESKADTLAALEKLTTLNYIPLGEHLMYKNMIKGIDSKDSEFNGECQYYN